VKAMTVAPDAAKAQSPSAAITICLHLVDLLLHKVTNLDPNVKTKMPLELVSGLV
jgi:hypothetical protein